VSCLCSGARFAYLKNIKQPTLVVSGNHNVIVYTVNSLCLVQNMPNANMTLRQYSAEFIPTASEESSASESSHDLHEHLDPLQSRLPICRQILFDA
jgi:hypothetical protein